VAEIEADRAALDKRANAKGLAGIEGWKGLRWLCGKQVAETRSFLCGDAGVSPQFTLVIDEIEKLSGCSRIA
jgi:hypothetical protein